MDAFLKGLLLGLTLAIMVGPIMIAIIQTSLEKGLKAGLTVGLGIWISDFLFIIVCFFGVKQLSMVTRHPNFELLMGLAGMIVLIGFGIGMIVTKAKEFNLELNRNTNKEYVGFFSTGFIVNSVNPFTFFFWISVSLSIIKFDSPDLVNYLPFYIGIMIPVIIGDIIKTFGANWIRKYINAKHVQKLRLISGIVFILFGGILAARVLF